MYATVLEQHLRDYSPNVLFYCPLQVDDAFVFVLHRLFRTLSEMVGDGVVEVLHVAVCPKTHIPTVQLMLPAQLNEQDFGALFDDTQRLLHQAAAQEWKPQPTEEKIK